MLYFHLGTIVFTVRVYRVYKVVFSFIISVAIGNEFVVAIFLQVLSNHYKKQHLTAPTLYLKFGQQLWNKCRR